jgi:hypothetical protein
MDAFVRSAAAAHLDALAKYSNDAGAKMRLNEKRSINVLNACNGLKWFG